MLSLSVIILSGGKSSRMGRDKALIEIAGVPLLQRTAAIALHLSPQVFVVTTPAQHHEAVLPNAVEVILEPQPQGPLLAFAQALTRVDSDWVLLLACDLPNLELETLRSWVSNLERVDAVAYLAKHPKGWEPLCGFYRVNSLAKLNEFIRQGGSSFQKWLATEAIAELPIEDSRILFNCNTTADLAEAIQNFSPPH